MQITNSRYPTSSPERLLKIGVGLLCLSIDEHVIGAVGFRPEHKQRVVLPLVQATISSTSTEESLSRVVAIRDPAQLSCFQHSQMTLGGISNNFLYARSANNLGTSSLPVAHVSIRVANKLVLESATLDSLISIDGRSWPSFQRLTKYFF